MELTAGNSASRRNSVMADGQFVASSRLRRVQIHAPSPAAAAAAEARVDRRRHTVTTRSDWTLALSHVSAFRARVSGSSTSSREAHNDVPTIAHLFSLASQGKGSELVSSLSALWCQSATDGKRKGAEPCVDHVVDETGKSLLHVACEHGHAEVAQVLAQLGADLRRATASESTVVPRYGPRMQQGPDGCASAQRSPEDIASCGSGQGSIHNMSSLVLGYGGHTVLHFAAKSHSPPLLKWLLAQLQGDQHGDWLEDVNRSAADGSTALHCSLERRHDDFDTYDDGRRSGGGGGDRIVVADTLRQLLASGADADAATHTRRRWCALLGRRPRPLKSRVTAGLTALHCAVDAGDARAVRLLVAAGCAVDARTTGNGVCDAGMTALHLACEQLQPECVRALLAGGADPNARDARRAAALHTALLPPATDLLVNTFRVFYRSAVDSPLSLESGERDAVARARVDIVRMLLEAGADRHAVARPRLASDPCLSPRTPRMTKSCLSTSASRFPWPSGGRAGHELSAVDMAMHEACLGGRSVVQLLGTCFAQPTSLRCACVRVAARAFGQRLCHCGDVEQATDFLDRLCA